MCTWPLKCFLWPSVFLRPLKGKWLKTACWETPGPKKTVWVMKKFSLLPEESVVEKVDSEVIFEISYEDNTGRIEPFKKNCFWLCQPVYSPSYLVLCARPWLPAWYVRSRGPPASLPLLEPGIKTHIPVILRCGPPRCEPGQESRGGVMSERRERGEVG